jgi:hypothetical protein
MTTDKQATDDRPKGFTEKGRYTERGLSTESGNPWPKDERQAMYEAAGAPADDAAPEVEPSRAQDYGPKGLWNIPELCIWAATRVHAAVNAVSSDYDPEDARHLDADQFLSDSYGAHVAAWFATEDTGRPTRLDVCHQLPSLFENGTLTVFGLLYDKGELTQIPPEVWNLGCSVTHSALRDSWWSYGQKLVTA